MTRGSGVRVLDSGRLRFENPQLRAVKFLALRHGDAWGESFPHKGRAAFQPVSSGRFVERVTGRKVKDLGADAPIPCSSEALMSGALPVGAVAVDSEESVSLGSVADSLSVAGSARVQGCEVPKPRVTLPGLRLRPRSRVTRTLESLGGVCRSWWGDLAADATPAVAAALWLQQYLGPEASLSDVVREVRRCDGSKSGVHAVMIPVGSDGPLDRLYVCPELIAELSLAGVFRAPGIDLLNSLRGRARLWAVEKELDELEFSVLLPGTLVLAAQGSTWSHSAAALLRSDRASYAARLFSALSSGEAVDPSRRFGFWGGLWRATRWGFRRTPVMHAGAYSVRLAA
jgi:hypothetical protein